MDDTIRLALDLDQEYLQKQQEIRRRLESKHTEKVAALQQDISALTQSVTHRLQAITSNPVNINLDNAHFLQKLQSQAKTHQTKAQEAVTTYLHSLIDLKSG
jgi:chorismate-pyruvate lyase